jgi:hypothetical protein
MPHAMDGPLMKLERAKEHIDQFERELRVWRERSNPYRASFLGHSQATGNLWQFHVKDCPSHIGAVFGDAVGNLRAVLVTSGVTRA